MMITDNDDWSRFTGKFIYKWAMAGLYCPYDEAPSAACHWEPGEHWSDIGKDYNRAEQPWWQEIESCVRFVTSNWESDFDLENGNSVSPEARYFLTVRVEAIVLFLRVIPGLFQTLIPFPSTTTDAEFSEWLLLDWFILHGPTIAAMQRSSSVFRVSGDKQELISYLNKEVPDFPEFLKKRLRVFRGREPQPPPGTAVTTRS